MTLLKFKSRILFLSLMLAQFSFAEIQLSCGYFYSQESSDKEAKILSLYLNGPAGTSLQPTVKTVGNRNNKVIFSKDKDGLWVSKHDAVINTLTAEGDVRLPIFLLGTELAAKLGYVIREIENNQIEIEVPDADLLAYKIGKINESLKARGLEPITYLPVRTGFVTVRETIQLILSAKDDYLIHFPYADKDLVIAPHEVSFHLGSIVLNKAITSRARILTEETQLLIDLLEQHSDKLGPQVKRLMGQLRIERNFEMDAGLASMVTSPGFTRRDGGMKSYTQLYPEFSARYWNYMLRNIEFLMRPTMQPHEAILNHLQRITGLDLSDINPSSKNDFQTMTIPIARVGTKVEMDAQSLLVLKSIATNYSQRPRTQYEVGPPSYWLEGFLKNLDTRIQEISDSLPN